jgi:hypothetical protein
MEVAGNLVSMINPELGTAISEGGQLVGAGNSLVSPYLGKASMGGMYTSPYENPFIPSVATGYYQDPYNTTMDTENYKVKNNKTKEPSWSDALDTKGSNKKNKTNDKKGNTSKIISHSDTNISNPSSKNKQKTPEEYQAGTSLTSFLPSNGAKPVSVGTSYNQASNPLTYLSDKIHEYGQDVYPNPMSTTKKASDYQATENPIYSNPVITMQPSSTSTIGNVAQTAYNYITNPFHLW